MKRLLIMLMASVILLMACGSSEVELVNSYKMVKVHEDISDEVLSDVNDVIGKIENDLAEGNDLTEDSFRSFLDKYETELDHVNRSEFEFILALSLLMMSIDGYIDGEYNLTDDIDRLYGTAKTGEYQPLKHEHEHYEDFYEGVASSFHEDDQQEQEEVGSKGEEQVEDVSEVEGAIETGDDAEIDSSGVQYNTDEIKRSTESIVDKDLENTTITNLRINEDASVDEERYIVLVDLEWDVKNKPKMTKEMLDMYSDHLAAKLADNESVYELVLFWTVPYHNESDSILKRTYQNRDGGMYLENEMADINVFN